MASRFGTFVSTALVACVLILATWPSRAAEPSPVAVSPEALAKEAADAFAAGDYPSAEHAYRELLDNFPESVGRGEAAYWLGESLYRQGRHEEAAEAYGQALALGATPEISAFALYSIARADLEAGKTDLAEAAFRQFIDRYPRHRLCPDCLRLLGDLELKRGAVSAAEPLYQRLLSDYPGSALVPAARFGLGCVRQQANAWAEARALFDQVTADSASPEAESLRQPARLRAADCSYLLGDYQRAAADYASIPAGAPEASRAQYGLALTYTAQGNLQESGAILTALADRSDEPDLAARAALRLADRSLEHGAGPEATSWYGRAGKLAQSQALRDEADLGLLTVRSAGQPDLPAADATALIAARHPSDQLGAQANFLAGSIYLFAGDPTHAASSLTASLSIDPKGPNAAQALLLLGKADKLLGDREAAIGAWEKAVASFPEASSTAETFQELIRAQLEGGSLAAAGQAASTYARCCTPSLPMACVLLDTAEALRAAGRHADAAPLARTALETVRLTGIEGSDVSGPRARILYELGLIALGEKDWSSAYSNLTQAEAAAGSGGGPLLALLPSAEFHAAEGLFEAGRYDEALSSYRHLVEVFPTSEVAGPCHYKLGWCQLRGNHDAEALSEFLAALNYTQTPEVEADARYEAASLLLERGENARAIELVTPFQQRFSDNPLRTHALTVLGRAALRQNDFVLARDAFLAALQGLADDEAPLPAIAGLATAQQQLGESTEAIATLRRALSQAKDESALQLRHQLAGLYVTLGQLLPAAKEYDTIARQNEGETAAAAMIEAGKLYQQAGEMEAAKLRFSTVVTRFASMPRYADTARLRLMELNR